jgi:uncharacterized membrane protein
MKILAVIEIAVIEIIAGIIIGIIVGIIIGIITGITTGIIIETVTKACTARQLVKMLRKVGIVGFIGCRGSA